MVITRTPLRVSLCSSGGSDLPAYYSYGIPGMSLTAAINRYMYISVNPKFDGRWRLCYSKTEDVEYLDDLEHDLAREALRFQGVQDGIEIHSCCDIPAGTGLGSSGAFLVGLLHALRIYHHHAFTRESIAERACIVEISLCDHPVGKQDQYASALGGVRLLKFEPDGSVVSSPMTNQDLLTDLRRHLLLLWTGKTRDANIILRDQQILMSSSSYREAVFQIAGRALSFATALSVADWETCGEILDESWQLKRGLSSGVTDPQIDTWYDSARQMGAWGGKVCGAGGGGFLLFIAEPDRHISIANELDLEMIPFNFDLEGTKLIYLRERGN